MSFSFHRDADLRRQPSRPIQAGTLRSTLPAEPGADTATLAAAGGAADATSREVPAGSETNEASPADRGPPTPSGVERQSGVDGNTARAPRDDAPRTGKMAAILASATRAAATLREFVGVAARTPFGGFGSADTHSDAASARHGIEPAAPDAFTAGDAVDPGAHAQPAGPEPKPHVGRPSEAKAAATQGTQNHPSDHHIHLSDYEVGSDGTKGVDDRRLPPAITYEGLGTAALRAQEDRWRRELHLPGDIVRLGGDPDIGHADRDGLQAERGWLRTSLGNGPLEVSSTFVRGDERPDGRGGGEPVALTEYEFAGHTGRFPTGHFNNERGEKLCHGALIERDKRLWFVPMDLDRPANAGIAREVAATGNANDLVAGTPTCGAFVLRAIDRRSASGPVEMIDCSWIEGIDGRRLHEANRAVVLAIVRSTRGRAGSEAAAASLTDERAKRATPSAAAASRFIEGLGRSEAGV